MEDLLASIRKAINEDIGPDTAPADTRPTGTRGAPAPNEPAATTSEIQQLREKITRSRNGGEPPPPRDPAQRAASLAAALRSQTPRRAWRDLEALPKPVPQQPAPRLRASIIDDEATPRAPLRTEPPSRPPVRYTLDSSQPPAEGNSVAVARETERAPKPEEQHILSSGSAQAVQSAFSRLADTVLARAIGEQSIEQMTHELLKVMLKQWLDDNLPSLVERLVREEIERVARTGR